jgi:type IV pilus assembly protein PilQ
MMKLIKLLIVISLSGSLSAQTVQQNLEPEYPEAELISISRSTNLVAALRAIEVLSLQFENKKIVTTSGKNDPIGVPINKIYWKEALQLIARLHNLDLEERPGSYMVADPVAKEGITVTGALGETEEVITPFSKQIRISSIFFKTDETISRDIGIDWSTLFNGQVNAQVDFTGANKVAEDIFKAATSYNFQTGDVSIGLNVLLRILEQYQKGTVIAKPSVSVISGKTGLIQVGQDFSVKTLDDAGNTTETFFSTGIILRVTPHLIEKDGEEAIYLEANVEKSSATPGDVTTIIDKSSAATNVLLFDGEETVIGGLFDTDRTSARAGVPFLKDLPWWFFGLRYIFGYNRYSVVTNEMIIIIKAELIDSVPFRKNEMKPVQQQMIEQRQSFEEDIKNIQK